MKNLFPNNIKHIAIVAPASYSPPNELDKVMKSLKNDNIKVSIMPNVYKKNAEKYLSADIQSRVDDIHSAFLDKSIDLIWCLRGGYGAAALLDYLDWELLRTRKIPFLGYSDITALHCAMYANNVGIPITAPLATSSDEFYSTESIKFLHKAIEQKEEIMIHLKDIITIKAGNYSGIAICANMSILASLIGTKYMPNLNNKILILEDINEEVSKLDRILTQFAQVGILSKSAGVFFGNFKNCGKEEELKNLFKKYKKFINGPIIAGFPFGHKPPFMSMRFGQKFKLSLKVH